MESGGTLATRLLVASRAFNGERGGALNVHVLEFALAGSPALRVDGLHCLPQLLVQKHLIGPRSVNCHVTETGRANQGRGGRPSLRH